MIVCRHTGCTTCRAIIVGLLAEQLRTVPEAVRAALCVEAMKAAKRCA